MSKPDSLSESSSSIDFIASNKEYIFENDSLCASIPGVVRYEWNKEWFEDDGEDESRYRFESSLRIFADTLFSNDKVRSKINELVSKEVFYIYSSHADTLVLNNIPSRKLDIDKFADSLFESLSSLYCKAVNYPDSAYLEILPLQNLFLVHNIYETADYVTYIINATNYEHGGCGCRSSSDYISIDKSTGSEMPFDEVISSLPEAILNQRLNKSYKDAAEKIGFNPDKITANSASGAAFVEGGIVVYYHPYTIGCGAEGQYNLFIHTE